MIANNYLRSQLFYKGADLEGKKLLWALFDRLIIALHVNPDNDLYLPPRSFRLHAQLFARLFEFVMPSRFSPYMHTLVDHVYQMLALYKTIHQFSCQQLELQHSIHKKFFLRRTTKRQDTASLRAILERETRELAGARYNASPEPREYNAVVRASGRTRDLWCLRGDTAAIINARDAIAHTMDQLVAQGRLQELAQQTGREASDVFGHFTSFCAQLDLRVRALHPRVAQADAPPVSAGRRRPDEPARPTSEGAKRGRRS